MADAGDARALQREFDAAMDEAEKQTLDILRQSVLDGVAALANFSPVDTGWYVRNHRVAVNGGSVGLQPRNVDRGPLRGTGRLAVGPATLRRREGVKLRKLKLGDDVLIGNAVPYAGTIEGGTTTRPEGNFYQRASDVVAAAIERRGRA